MKMRVLGIFPDATVVRGMDWEWKDQDGNIYFFNLLFIEYCWLQIEIKRNK
jgi:hypothetical protein